MPLPSKYHDLIQWEVEAYLDSLPPPDPDWPVDVRLVMMDVQEHLFEEGLRVEEVKQRCGMYDHNISGRFKHYTGIGIKKLSQKGALKGRFLQLPFLLRIAMTNPTTFAPKATAPEALPTIWRASDDLWRRIEPVLFELDPPAATGRPRADARAVFDAIIHRGRTSTQWNQLPKSFPNGDPFPDDSTVHRTMQRWIEKGVFTAIWTLLIEECDELGGVSFEWQVADTSLGKLARAARSSAATRPTAAKLV